MDYALSLRCGQSPSNFNQVLASSCPKTAMISARSWAKPHVFFRNNSCPPISQPTNVFCGASKVLRSPILGRHALVSPVQTLACSRLAPYTLRASFALACGLGICCFASMLVLSPRKAKGAFFPLLSPGGRSQQPRMMTNGPQNQPLNARSVLKEFMEGVLLLSLSANDKDPVNITAEGKCIDAADYPFFKAARKAYLRSVFYEAIIYTLLDKKEIAKEAWEDFIKCGFNEDSKGAQPRQRVQGIFPWSACRVVKKFVEGFLFLSSSTLEPKAPSVDETPDIIIKYAKEKALWQMKNKKDKSRDKVLEEMRSKLKFYIDQTPPGEENLQANFALLEVMVLQGNYTEAAKSPFLEKALDTDLRKYFYKAIVHTLLDEKKIAKEAWEDFIEYGFNEDSEGPTLPTPQMMST